MKRKYSNKKQSKNMFITVSIILLILLILYIIYIYYNNYKNNNVNNEYFTNEIPIVIICWNNYYFVKNFVSQLLKYDNPIIILDNHSDYPELLDYYKEIKTELKDRIDIRMLDKNYGHKVYITLKDTLPNVYILSDPDLQLNDDMPKNFSEILLKLSDKYKSYKVGVALNIEDHDKFIKCDNYTKDKNIHDWELQFWKNKINDDEYELYYADTDTTFCLINNNYNYNNNHNNNNIRIANNFTAKHLPWYEDYIKNNISQKEIDHWKSNNKSSSILFTCLKL